MKYVAVIILFIAPILWAQDTITFLSGKEYSCECISYEDGAFTVKVDGVIKQAPLRQVKRVVFGPTVVQTGPGEATEESNTIAPATTVSFRKATWGMTIAEVKAIEESTPSEESTTSLTYKDRVGGLEASVVYSFAQDCLVSGGYVFEVKHTNNNDFIQDYERIEAVLAEKYGSPMDEKVYWKQTLYKSDREKWGFAISLGHLMYYSIRQTQDTKLMHSLQGENYQITHIVGYESIKLKGLSESQSKSRYLEKL